MTADPSNPILSAGSGAALDRGDYYYYSFIAMLTVGFGDIVAVSDVARMTVVVQMIANLVLLALVVQLITGVARWARTQRSLTAEAAATPDAD